MKKYLMLLAAAGMFTFTACDNDDDETVTLTKTQMLTNKNWVVTAETATSGSNTIDLYADYEACDKDDFYRFMTDGKFTFDEGANKCDSTAAQSQSGNWSFGSNESVLTISDVTGSFSISRNIAELTNNRMVLTISETDTVGGAPITYTTITTYTAQ